MTLAGADSWGVSLSTALFAHTTAPDSVPRRNAHFFHAAKSASIARLVALDRIIPEFERLSKEGRTMQRMFEETNCFLVFLQTRFQPSKVFASGHISSEPL
jgi:hypothetical protein